MFCDPNDVEFGLIMGKYSISAYGPDMEDRGLGDISFKPKSPISYLLDGNAPHRILKIEWKKCWFL